MVVVWWSISAVVVCQRERKVLSTHRCYGTSRAKALHTGTTAARRADLAPFLLPQYCFLSGNLAQAGGGRRKAEGGRREGGGGDAASRSLSRKMANQFPDLLPSASCVSEPFPQPRRHEMSRRKVLRQSLTPINIFRTYWPEGGCPSRFGPLNLNSTGPAFFVSKHPVLRWARHRRTPFGAVTSAPAKHRRHGGARLGRFPAT